MMAENSFRVLLDLSEINLDLPELKYVWMSVFTRELKTIRDFKRAIIKKFPNIQENFNLYVEDGLLLDSEKIAVLREDDTVKLQTDSSTQSVIEYGVHLEMSSQNGNREHLISHSSKSVKESRKRKSESCLTSYQDDATSKKRSKKKKKSDKSPRKSEFFEPIVVDISSSVSSVGDNYQGVVSHFHPISESVPNVSKSNEKSNDGNSKPSKNSKPKMSTCDFITYATSVSRLEKNNENFSISNNDMNVTSVHLSDTFSKTTNEIEFEENLTGGTHAVKKKRKRKRKRKNNSKSGTMIDNQTSTEDVNFETSATSVNNDCSSEKRKHVLYHSPSSQINVASIILESDPCTSHNESENLESSCDKNINNGKSSSSENNSMVQDHNSYKENNCQSLNKTNMSPKVSTPFSKKSLKVKSWGVTPMPKISSTDSNTFSIENSKEEKNSRPHYNHCPRLNSVPAIGTRLAYKTLELNQNYCPEVTEFKEGILKYIDPVTDELEIELIEEEIKPGRTGKFENLKKDEIPSPQIIKMVSLSWSALIDPRLVN